MQVSIHSLYDSHEFVISSSGYFLAMEIHKDFKSGFSFHTWKVKHQMQWGIGQKMGHTARVVRFIKEEPPDTARGAFVTDEN